VNASVSVLILFGTLVLTGLGVVLVLFGTLVKNRWGINLEPVSCPRCNTPLPMLREPRSLRQRVWGGWTCPVCGAGVDKWGREIAPIAPPTFVRSADEWGRIRKKRTVVVAAVTFCVFMLGDYVRMAHRGFPSSWEAILLEAAINIMWTVLFLGAFHLVWKFLRERIKSPQDRKNPADGAGPTGRGRPDNG